MRDDVFILIPIALVIMSFAAALSIYLPSLFVSMFLAYPLFKMLLRAYFPPLSQGYTVDIAVALLATIGAFAHWWKYRHGSIWGSAPKRLFLIYGLFLLLMIVTYPMTNAPDSGAKKILIFGVMTPFCILIPALYLQRLQDINRLLLFLLGWGGVASIMTLFFGVNLVEDTGAVRISAGYASSILVTAIVAYGAIAALSNLAKINKLPLLYIPVAMLVFIYTGTRGPVVMLIVPILYVLFVMRLKRIWLPMMLFPLLAGLLLYLIKSTDVSSGMVRFETMGEGVSDRWVMIKTVLSQSTILDLIIGSGIGNTGYILRGFDEWASPHNSIVEMWVELGLLGLTLILWLFGWVAVSAFKLRNECRDLLKHYMPVVVMAGLALYGILESLKMRSFITSFDTWFFISAALVCRQRFITLAHNTQAAQYQPPPHLQAHHPMTGTNPSLQ